MYTRTRTHFTVIRLGNPMYSPLAHLKPIIISARSSRREGNMKRSDLENQSVCVSVVRVNKIVDCTSVLLNDEDDNNDDAGPFTMNPIYRMRVSITHTLPSIYSIHTSMQKPRERAHHTINQRLINGRRFPKRIINIVTARNTITAYLCEPGS